MENVDGETARIILNLQFSDYTALLGEMRNVTGEHGVQVDGTFLAQMQQELNALVQFQNDDMMARSLARAVGDDGDLVEQCRAEEQQAAQDHQMARELEDAEDSDDSDDGIEDGMSIIAETTASSVPLDAVECLVCTSEVARKETFKLPCGHFYCKTCLQALYRMAMVDETLYPPRCCRQTIPWNARLRSFFHSRSELTIEFSKKKLELDSKDRTYCYVPYCAAFIPPNRIEHDKAACPSCNNVTCILCKGASHSGDCPQDTELQELLLEAGRQGWQRCSACRRVIELGFGCNHITCICGAEFCYVCGETWKTCRCEQWNEQNLIDRAAVIAERVPDFRQPGENAAAVRAAAAERVAANHDCQHLTTRRVRGEHMCEMCHNHLNLYIYECTHCQFQLCHPCLRNRLG